CTGLCCKDWQGLAVCTTIGHRSLVCIIIRVYLPLYARTHHQLPWMPTRPAIGSPTSDADVRGTERTLEDRHEGGRHEYPAARRACVSGSLRGHAGYERTAEWRSFVWATPHGSGRPIHARSRRRTITAP